MKKSLALVGMAALVVLDVVLVFLALRGPSLPASADLGTPTPVVSGTADPTTATKAATKTTEAVPYTPAALTLMISGLDATHAWRATAGTCKDGGARVQTTSNRGKTWSKGSEPGSAVVRVQPVSTTKGFVYAADEKCALGEYVSDDGAKTWRAPTDVTGAWTRQAKNASTVITPADANAKPCGKDDVIDLSRASTEAAYVLCRDGTLRHTSDGGASWSDAGSVPGGLSIGFGQGGLYVVRGGSASDCAGLQVLKTTAGTKPTPVGCIESPGPADPGAVSLSVTKAAGWLAVGDETWTSPDLVTWAKA